MDPSNSAKNVDGQKQSKRTSLPSLIPANPGPMHQDARRASTSMTAPPTALPFSGTSSQLIDQAFTTMLEQIRSFGPSHEQMAGAFTSMNVQSGTMSSSNHQQIASDDIGQMEQSDTPQSTPSQNIPSLRTTYRQIPVTSRGETAQPSAYSSSGPIRTRSSNQQIMTSRNKVSQDNTLPSFRPPIILPLGPWASRQPMSAAPAATTANSESEQQHKVDGWTGRVVPEPLDAVRTTVVLSCAPRFKCFLCGDFSTTVEQLRLHLSAAHPRPQSFVCKREGCGQAFQRDYQLSNHTKYGHSGNGWLKCDHCQRHLATTQALRRHQTPKICEPCGRVFTCQREVMKGSHDCGTYR